MLFETRAGPVRLRWNQQGLTAIEMPELRPRELRAELAKQNGNPAPPFVADAARLLQRHLAGEAEDLRALAVDHGLTFDPVAAVEHLRGRDRRLAKFIDQVGPFRLRPAELQSPFEALLESIVYQQLTGRAAATILARVVALFRPRRFPRPQE